MKCNVSTVCVFLCTLIVVCYSAPFLPAQYSVSSNLQIDANNPPSTTVATTSSTSGSGGGLTNILSDIDLPGLLRGVNSVVKIVGIFCPPLSQVLDNVIQNVTSTAFRVFGRLILQSGGLGGSGGSGGSGGDTQRVSVVLPTFPPDEDEDYDEDEDSDAETISSTSSSNNNEIVSRLDVRIDESSTTSTTTTDNVSPSNEDNAISKRHVRVIRDADDQEEAESAPQPAEDANDGDDADRNKRYLPFGGSVNAQVSAGGGGSGNFLFDIIRNTADRAARTVGTVYRMVAGTENFGYGLTTTSETTYKTSAAPTVKLVAGSGATEESDHHANTPGGVAEIDITKAVGHDTTAGEGIPGPITRLFVIANRGLANLVQDLILRLAQTSERLVNFKARLITSLI